MRKILDTINEMGGFSIDEAKPPSQMKVMTLAQFVGDEEAAGDEVAEPKTESTEPKSLEIGRAHV